MTEIRLERDGDLAIVTIDRPEKRNAMHFDMWLRLADIMHGLAGDADLRAVILTGAGGHFCAGADIGEFGQKRSSVEQGQAYNDAVDGACDAMIALPRPVIAAIDGSCYGGGCGLAICCDFRIAAQDARLAIPAAKLSIVYSLRETQMLAALVGLANAKRILMAAETFEPAAAKAMGLIDEIAPGSALPAARAFAAKFGPMAPLSLEGHKLILNGLALGLGALDTAKADAVRHRSLGSADYAEGRRAFAEKRKPRFTGR